MTINPSNASSNPSTATQDLGKLRRKQYIALIQKRVRPGSGSNLAFMQSRTWAYPVADLNRIIQETPFVVVRGVATRLYMPERMTLDIDILVFSQDAPGLYRELNQASAKRIGLLTVGGSSWQLADGTVLDVIESSEAWVTQAVQNPNLDPTGLPIIALPYLVLMKSRAQDIADLSRMLGGADEELLGQVRAVVKTHMDDAVEDLERLITLGKLEYQVPE
ncbi:MAG: hypothetical protein WCA07_09925 [Gloeobacterales cyanobacterium]